MNIPSRLIRYRDLSANHSHQAAVRDNTRLYRDKANNVGPFLLLYIDPAGWRVPFFYMIKEILFSAVFHNIDFYGIKIMYSD